MKTAPKYPALYHATQTQLAIDNHAHPLLRSEARHALTFEGSISEASGSALEDAKETLAAKRAAKQLANLYDLDPDRANWESVKAYRETVSWEVLCKICFEKSGIESIYVDDGLGGGGLADDWKGFERFGKAVKRVERIEVVAEVLLKRMFGEEKVPDGQYFRDDLREALVASAKSEEVVAFKSIVCYRSGLDVNAEEGSLGNAEDEAILGMFAWYMKTGAVRIAAKVLNDAIVRIALEVAGQYDKPVQFHTGLGDNDITLTKASPAHLQPIIKQYPQTKIVLLHSSYPYTRDAGYLTAMYKNVYLDFGEVFPAVGAGGQRDIVRQMFELAPTNKLLWSSDGHWWPETFYLASIQAREVLYEVSREQKMIFVLNPVQVLSETVERMELSEAESVAVVKQVLHGNADKLYRQK